MHVSLGTGIWSVGREQMTWVIALITTSNERVKCSSNII